jgi:Flp pilus assembly protein TadD
VRGETYDNRPPCRAWSARAPFLNEGAEAHQRDPEDRRAREYRLGRNAVEAKDWAKAVELLTKAEVQDDRNPDLENLLGYAYRHIGRFNEAFRHYEMALRLNPRHRGAHEYIGEAFLMVNNPAKAAEHLAALKEICVIPCEEYADLEKAIAAYRTQHRK